MAEITAIAMTKVLSSNLSDNKRVAVIAFKNISDEDYTIALPIPQLVPLIELAMIELRKSEFGADVGALEASSWRVEGTGNPDQFALAFETTNGGQMAHALSKSDLPNLREALQALENG